MNKETDKEEGYNTWIEGIPDEPKRERLHNVPICPFGNGSRMDYNRYHTLIEIDGGYETVPDVRSAKNLLLHMFKVGGCPSSFADPPSIPFSFPFLLPLLSDLVLGGADLFSPCHSFLPPPPLPFSPFPRLAHDPPLPVLPLLDHVRDRSTRV